MKSNKADLHKPMKILQISTADQAGGAESSAYNLNQAYLDLGHQSWLAVGNLNNSRENVFQIPNDAWRSPWAKLLNPLIKNQVPRDSIQFYGQFLIKLISEPRRVIERRCGREDFDFPGTTHLLDLLPSSPDIIHCHNLHGGYFNLKYLPQLSWRFPLILNLRDSWLLSGHCAHSNTCTRWKTGCGACPDLNIYPAIPRDATHFNWTRKKKIYQTSRLYITTVSQWLMDKVHQSILSGVKYKVIYNGIDTELFQPGPQDEARRALGLPPDAEIILFTGHSEFKDTHTMIEACAGLHTDNHKKLVFVCLGQSGEDIPTGEGLLIQPGRIIDPVQMVLYYQAADIYIHAAFDEAFGKTVTEAMACEVPVVATAVGGIPEQIKNGENGFLVSKENAISMAQAVQALINDPDLRSRMSKAGRETVLIKFTLKQQVSQFLDWYAEILEDWQEAHQPFEDGYE